MKPIVLVITDSLGFPRAVPEVLPYSATYLARLAERFPDISFLHQGRGGATIEELYEHTSYFHATVSPLLVIMQCGIVDCAPRSLSRTESMVVRHLPVFRHVLGPIVKQNAPRLRKWRNLRYTTPQRFVECVGDFESTYPSIIWLGITPSNPVWERTVPGIGESINAYNDILRQRRFVSLDDLEQGALMSDQHHPNSIGHAQIFNKLVPIIDRSLSQHRL